MITIKNDIEVNASRQELWQLLLRFNEKYSEISRNHVSFKCIEGSLNKVGSIYKVRNHFKGKIVEIKYKLVKVVENEGIFCNAEFPHALLGMKFGLTISGNSDKSIITEEITFGTRIPLLEQIFNTILKIYLLSSLKNIEKDQNERLEGFRKLFEKKPEKIAELVE